jgi:hypothetical protein
LLAPLLRFRSADRINNEFPGVVCLGRGQILGLQGPCWRELFAKMMDPDSKGETRIAIAEIRDTESLAHCCDRMSQPDAAPLWMISTAIQFTAVERSPLPGLLEKFAQAGGGAVLGMDQLPDGLPLTQVITPPSLLPAGELTDDQGMPVRFLRQGEWGTLRFPLLAGFSLRAIENIVLHVSGNVDSWDSLPVDLQPWKSLAAEPDLCCASFATPWPPGEYSARLRFSPAVHNPDPAPAIRFKIRPSTVNVAPVGKHVVWRFAGSPPLSRKLVRLNQTIDSRSRLDLSEGDREHLLSGWHDAEYLGGQSFRRWTKRRAAATLGGPGNRLRIILDDYRPRSGDDAPTSLQLQVDDQTPTTRAWQLPGRQVIELSWPDDCLTHQIALEITPAWSPKSIGLSDDARELGVLLYGLEVFHER